MLLLEILLILVNILHAVDTAFLFEIGKLKLHLLNVTVADKLICCYSVVNNVVNIILMIIII